MSHFGNQHREGDTSLFSVNANKEWVLNVAKIDWTLKQVHDDGIVMTTGGQHADPTDIPRLLRPKNYQTHPQTLLDRLRIKSHADTAYPFWFFEILESDGFQESWRNSLDNLLL